MHLRLLIVAALFTCPFLLGGISESAEQPKVVESLKRTPVTAKNSAKSSNEKAERETQEKPAAEEFAPHKNRDADEAKYRRDSDQKQIEIQERIAGFTGRLVVIGFLQVLVAGIGLAAIYVSWIAAKAAKQSADIARDALIKLERPFVFVTEFPWLWHADTGRPGRYWYTIHPNVKNTGRTPATQIFIAFEYAVRDSPLPDAFDFPLGTKGLTTPIPPGGIIGGPTGSITDDILLAIQMGTKYLYAWGCIEYQDSFEGTPTHTTKFCVHITRVLGNPLDPCIPNDPKGTSAEIIFGIYPKHNDGD